MKKIGEIAPAKGPKMVIYYDPKPQYNPYKVCLVWKELTDHGLVQRRKLLIRYADLASCGWMMKKHMERYNEEGRP